MVQQIGASHDFGDAVGNIVGHNSEIVADYSVSTDKAGISARLGKDGHRAYPSVMELHHAVL